MNRNLVFLSTFMSAAMLTACGGGSGSAGSLPPSGGGQSTQSSDVRSIDAANSLGSPIKDFSDYNESAASPLAQHARQGQSVQRLSANGQCSNGIEFFSPDKKGDPSSTERIVFYDRACTQPAEDAVRLFTSTGSNSETVYRTVTLYASGSSSPLAVRSETNTITDADFDQYGYPAAANGFDRTSSGNLGLNGVRTIDSDSELSLGALSGNSQTFCGDSAGFNATGNQKLGVTFGWAGTAATGTRTVNDDGSVTWSATHNGSSYVGPIGSLSIATGAQNTTCPVSAPMFSLTGGTTKGSYSLPVSATFASGILTNLTIADATLANGDTLNVQTNSGQQPTSPAFITGTVAAGNTQIATISVNAFGDGTLEVVASGTTYSIVDWHVVK